MLCGPPAETAATPPNPFTWTGTLLSLRQRGKYLRRDLFFGTTSVRVYHALHGERGARLAWCGAGYGRLSAGELQRLTDEIMRPSLTQGDLAGAITQGLDAVQQDVRRAGVEPTPGSTDASEPGWLHILSELLLSTFQLAAGIIAMVVVVQSYWY